MPETERSIIKDLKPGDVIGGPFRVSHNVFVADGYYEMVVADQPDNAHGSIGGIIPFILVPAEKPQISKTV